MSRFFDLQPKVKQGSIPPVRFRTTVYPLPEDYDRPPPPPRQEEETDMSTESESDTYRGTRFEVARPPVIPDERVNQRIPVKLR